MLSMAATTQNNAILLRTLASSPLDHPPVGLCQLLMNPARFDGPCLLRGRTLRTLARPTVLKPLAIGRVLRFALRVVLGSPRISEHQDRAAFIAGVHWPVTPSLDTSHFLLSDS